MYKILYIPEGTYARTLYGKEIWDTYKEANELLLFFFDGKKIASMDEMDVSIEEFEIVKA